MIETTETHNDSNRAKVENYYRFHSHIYDATRWSFLFGRKAIFDFIPDLPLQPRILEIGCGTGQNIELMEYYFPDAQILGIDLSDEMLTKAREKTQDSDTVDFQKKEYGQGEFYEESFDLILLSYSLTMTGNQIENVLVQISQDLKPGGYIAVVDFHTSPFKWFRKWMGVNHVDLTGSVYPLLQKYFNPIKTEVNPAYWGLWSYFLFVGQQH